MPALGVRYMTTRYREYRIVQTPTLIVFAYNDGMHREIYMDGRTLDTDPNSTWMGYSIGRWDGDALVVESNGYTDRSWLDFGGHPHTEALRVTERYTRSTIGRIDRQVTLIDPSIFTKPVTLTIPLIALSPSRFPWFGTIVEFSSGANTTNVVLHYAEGDERGARRS